LGKLPVRPRSPRSTRTPTRSSASSSLEASWPEGRIRLRRDASPIATSLEGWRWTTRIPATAKARATPGRSCRAQPSLLVKTDISHTVTPRSSRHHQTLAPWAWTGSPDNPSAAYAASAIARAIGAARACEAREHASHNPPVVGSSPTRPTSYAEKDPLTDREIWLDVCKGADGVVGNSSAAEEPEGIIGG